MTNLQGRVRALRLHRRRVPKFVWDCIIILIFGHAATYIAAIVKWLAPKWSFEKSDWFLAPNFSMSMERVWYLKFSGELVLYACTYYVLAKIASKFSDTLFVVSFLLFGYHIIDAFLFWWDFNKSLFMYMDLAWTLLLFGFLIIFPVPEKRIAVIKCLF